MSKFIKHKQAGVTVGEVFAWTVILVVLTIIGMKLVPAYTEADAIQNRFVELANNPKYAKGKVTKAMMRNIRQEFAKQARIDNMQSLALDEIEVERGDDGHLIVKADYVVLIPLAKNVSLHINFQPSSDKVNQDDE